MSLNAKVVVICVIISVYLPHSFADWTKDFQAPLVVAHRGASGYRPENTLNSWELGINMGADYVEIDLISTKDHVLIAGHANELSETTNVEDHLEFASRKTNKTINGKVHTGWFTEDFTIQEVKTLRSRERFPFRKQHFNNLPTVATFEEFLLLVQAKEFELNRPIGLYIETKEPSYFQSIGLPLEEPLIEALHSRGYDKNTSRVFLQSFETLNLKKLKTMTQLPLIQLIELPDMIQPDTQRPFGQLITREGLKEISQYAVGIGPAKALVLPRTPSPVPSPSTSSEPMSGDDPTGTPKNEGIVDQNQKNKLLNNGVTNFPEPTTLVKDAHEVGLGVHPWTFRDEKRYYDDLRFVSIEEEIKAFLEAGVDGIFIDFPDKGVAVKRAWLGLPSDTSCDHENQHNFVNRVSASKNGAQEKSEAVLVVVFSLSVFIVVLGLVVIFIMRRYFR